MTIFSRTEEADPGPRGQSIRKIYYLGVILMNSLENIQVPLFTRIGWYFDWVYFDWVSEKQIAALTKALPHLKIDR